MATHRLRISLPGVLNRAAAVCRGSREWKHLEHPLKELLDHLRILRADPTEATLKEFLDVWADQGAPAPVPVPAPETH
jgi:hypothetical protein